jgi:predicted Fe-Mo cluster-binding NifX family protein
MDRIAIPTLNGKLCAHFGHCQLFCLADAESGRIVSSREVVPPPHEPGVLPAWLKEQGVGIIIAGGMGARAQQLFAASGIRVVVGAPLKSPAELIADFYQGTLVSGENLCDH